MKLDRESCVAIYSLLNRISNALINQNEEMQRQFINLNETFKDPEYEEYAAEFTACDKKINEIANTLQEMSDYMKNYSEKLFG